MIATYLVIDKVSTGRRISELLKSNNITPRDLQQYLGFTTVQAIYHWLDGTSIPSVDNLVLLSHLWGIPINDILRCRSIEYEQPH